MLFNYILLIYLCIFAGTMHHFINTFNTNQRICPFCQRQAEITQATEQIQNPVLRLGSSDMRASVAW